VIAMHRELIQQNDFPNVNMMEQNDHPDERN